MKSSAPHAPQSCSNCAAPITGRFCSACGEAAVHADDLRLSHLVHDFWHEFSHVDGKIWRTIRALLFQPGLLTAEYWAGRRGRWVRPLRIYLIVTALHLIFAPNAAGPTGLRMLVVPSPSGAQVIVATRPETARADTNGIGMARDFNVGRASITLDEHVDADHITAKVATISKWIQYLSLALFAAACWLLGRKQQRFYGAHLIFALHFYAFEYIVTGLWSRFAPLGNPLIPVAIGFVYLTVALRRTLRTSWVATIWRSWVLFVAVAMIELGLLVAALMIALRSAH